MDKVIVLKDWVPGWVRDSYTTQEEVDAFNEEYLQSQLEQCNTPTSSDNQALLVGEAVAKLESIDRDSLEKWLHRLPAALLVELLTLPGLKARGFLDQSVDLLVDAAIKE